MSPIPGGPGNPPKKKHKHPPPVVGHGHGHKSQSASGDPHPGGQHGGGVTGGVNNPGGSNPPSGGGTTHTAPPAWVVRRQQVLRRAGYNIAVDGIWGSASQAAWDAFTHRINPAQATVNAAIAKAKNAVPPGMVKLADGRIVSFQIARQMHLITQAQAQAAKAAPLTPAQIAEQRRIAQRTGHPGPVALQREEAKRLGQPDPTPLGRKQARKQAIAQANEEINLALERIVGPNGQHVMMNHDWLAQQARAGRINAHDLALLMRHGYIDPTDKSNVRAIQQTINHHLPKGEQVKVDGTYGVATDAALKTLFARTAARDFKAQVAHTRKQLFVPGIAQQATASVLGHKVTDPATLIRILQRGGPDATRLAAKMADLYEQHQEDLAFDRLKHLRAQQLGGTSPLDKVFGSPFDDNFLLAGGTVADRALAQSDSLRDFRTLTDAIIRHQQLNQLRKSLEAKHETAWWREGISKVGAVLNYPVSKVEGTLYAFQYWSAGINNAVARWTQEHTGLDTTWGLEDGTGTPRLLADSNHPYRYDREPDGYVSWHRSWHEGQISLSTITGFDRLAMDIVLDPLNLVGVGVLGKVTRGGFALAARGSLRSVDILDKVAPKLAPELYALVRGRQLKNYEAFARISQTGLVVPVRGWMGARLVGEETRRAAVWATVSSTRAEAIARVNLKIKEAFVKSLRPIAVARATSKVAGLGQHSDEIARLVDPAIRGDLDAATLAARDGLAEAAPNFLEAVLSIPTSLYARFDRTGAELSFTGRRLHSYLEEYASRSILTRYAIIRRFSQEADDLGNLSKLPIDQLRALAKHRLGDAEYRRLLDEAGSWYAGGVPLDFREAYFNELRLFTDRLENQLLPGLDELMRLRHGDSIWARLGEHSLGLLDEAGIAIRDALDRFFGFSVEEAYDPANYVTVPNPNFGREVTDELHQTLANDEIDRLTRSFDGWVEMKRRIDGSHITADFIEAKHASITRNVTDAWERLPNGMWRDTRETLSVPAPLARSLEPTARTAAHSEGAQIADILTGLDRLPGNVDAAPALEGVLAQLTGGDKWTRFADATARTEALQALAEGQMASHLYLRNGLVLDYLKSHQTWAIRRIYNLITLGLNTWKFATLPLRPAFYIRNQIDNYVKAFLAGLRDPRAFFNPEGKSIFDIAAYRAMRAGAGYFDAMFQTDVRGMLDHLENLFWQQPDSTISKLFGVYDIEVPPELYVHKRTIAGLGSDASRENVILAPSVSAVRGGDVRRALTHAQDWKDRWTQVIWDTMAARPENLAKRQLYNATYRKGIARGLTKDEASKEALAVIERTLFDYDKVTVLEEQLKVIAPFIFFWRKNATFWATTAAEQPWFFLTADKLYLGHEQTNGDMPDWMRRYVNLAPVAPITDAAGLTWVSDWLRDGSNFDPLNYVSFVQFYKAFKAASDKDNLLLPPDRRGSFGFVASIIDGLNSIGGLGLNPFYMEAGQRLGWLNRWSWRDIYPQTTVLQALTSTDWMRKTLGTGPTGLNVEDALLDPLFKRIAEDQPTGNQLGLDRFNFYVQQEMAGQVARGEPADRAKAEAKIRGYIAFQTLMGFAIGIFPRRITAEDLAFAQFQAFARSIETDDNLSPEQKDAAITARFFHLSPDEQEAYRLFKHRGYDPASFDRYRHGLDGARVFFQIEDPAEQQQYLQDHPEIQPIVNPVIGGRLPTDEYLKTQMLLARTDAVFAFGQKYLQGIDADPSVQQAAYDTLVTPSLRKFWAKNDTSYDLQQRQLAGAYFKYISGVQDTYFSIPDTDYAAKQDYLARHPELQDWWARNDGATDDYRNLMQFVNGTFRTLYFHFVDQGDWDSADEFLRRHPFIFDFTSSEGRIDPNGHWIPKSEQQRDYAKVAADLRAYYALPEHLRDDYARAHPLIGWFLTKYGAEGTPMTPGQGSYLPGGLTAHARDYLKVAHLLDAFFNLSNSEKAAFLARHPDLKAYFAKYAQQQQTSQHARDYLAVKPQLDAFFALPESKREAYLDRHPELRAYFAKYSSGRNGHTGASYEEATRRALAANPDIAQRYHFWMQLFALPPNKRPEFIHRHAADAGIFIYGSLSYDWRQQQEKRWHRQALRLGISDRSYLYQRVAPLLQLYFSLPESGGLRALFLQTNPDLQTYLDRYTGDPTGAPPKLRRLIEAYFRIPAFDPRRNQFLEDHPELRVYFNRDASPKERAMQAAIDGYFKLPYGPARDRYLAEHPEVRDYFDQRRHEHDLFSSLAAAFNESDPRMAAFREQYADIIPMDAMHLWSMLRQRAHQITQAPSRDDTGRQPADDQLATRRTRAVSA